MYQKKSNHIKGYQDKTVLDGILWLVENYLPQKKKKSSNEEFRLENFEKFIIKNINKWTSKRSKLLRGDSSHTKVIFTVGNWALPYLNFLKSIKLLK